MIVSITAKRFFPPQIKEQSVCIDADIGDVINKIVSGTVAKPEQASASLSKHKPWETSALFIKRVARRKRRDG